MKTYKFTAIYPSGRRNEYIGTIPELVEVFSYNLLAGHSWDSTIKTNPKTAVGLASALNKSAMVTRNYHIYYIFDEVK